MQSLEESGKIKKRNCEWLLTTHDRIQDIRAFVDEAREKLREFSHLSHVEGEGSVVVNEGKEIKQERGGENIIIWVGKNILLSGYRSSHGRR